MAKAKRKRVRARKREFRPMPQLSVSVGVDLPAIQTPAAPETYAETLRSSAGLDSVLATDIEKRLLALAVTLGAPESDLAHAPDAAPRPGILGGIDSHLQAINCRLTSAIKLLDYIQAQV